MHHFLPRVGVLFVCSALAACSGGGATVGSQQLQSQAVLGPTSASTAGAKRQTMGSSTSASGVYSYTAPWGGFSNSQIYVEPAGSCSYLAASLASGATWPSFLSGLAQGTTITIYGTPSYTDSWQQQLGCPTGGIVATSVTLGGAGTSSPAPSPTSAPVTGGGSFSFGNVAPNYDPPASWRPYSSNSTWNQKLSNPDNPTLDPNDYNKVQAMFNWAFGGNQTQGRIANPELSAIAAGRGGGGVPYYFARTSDPSVTINCTAGYGTCAMQGKQYYVPAKALYAQDNDHHMVVIQPDGSELDVWEWGQNLQNGSSQSPPWYGGQTVNVGWGGVANLTSGTGWDLGDHGLTSGGSDGLAGMVREPEIASGQINHALAANVYCTPTGTPVYPATHATDQSNCNGFSMSASQIITMGNRLWLDLNDSQINALSSMNNAQKTVLHALHNYGAFVTDDSGYGPLGIGVLESQIPGAVYGNDIVGSWAAANLPFWYQYQGLSWNYVLSGDDLTNIIAPHIHVLAPCVNSGYPGSRC